MSNALRLDKSLALWERAREVVPGGSQTNSKRPEAFSFGRYPIFIRRGHGGHVWDIDGNEYVDLVGGLGPVSLGYCYPAVDDAVREQLAQGVSSGLLWPVEVEAAEALRSVIPCARASGSVRFFKGGGEATAAAARIARAHTGRQVLLNSGYRGWPDTWAADADSAVPAVLGEYVLQFRPGDLDCLEQLLDRQQGRVAAVFVNLPYDGSLGADYLRSVRDLAHGHGALLVFDEIVHGFRMAVGGMQEHFGVLPDLACFAKAIANGLPLAAVLGDADVMAAAARSVISITYGGEALSLAACVAVAREYARHDVIGHLWRLGEQLGEGINQAGRDLGVPLVCRGAWPMAEMAFEVGQDQVGASWELFLGECARRGLLLRRGGLNMINFSHTEEDIRFAVQAVRGALEEMRRAGLRTHAAPAGGGSQQLGAWDP